MKEIMVFERDIEYLKELEREREEMFMTFPEYRTEQVPETYEELKTLFLDELKELNVMWFGDRFVENKSEEFWVKGILFKADKTLSIRDDNDNIRVIMTNIDYPLMWLLIQTTLNIKSNHLF